MELERIALEDEYFLEKKLFPNVDFYSGITMQALGFPTSMFSVLFAVGRTIGWIAQWKEMIEDPVRRDRPAASALHRTAQAGLRAARPATLTASGPAATHGRSAPGESRSCATSPAPGAQGISRGDEAHLPRHARQHRRALVAPSTAHRASRVLSGPGRDDRLWRGLARPAGRVAPRAVVVTHAHPYHALGLKDGTRSPVHATAEAWEDMDKWPIADRHLVHPRRPVSVERITFEAFPVEHSLHAPAVGYRVSAGRSKTFDRDWVRPWHGLEVEVHCRGRARH